MPVPAPLGALSLLPVVLALGLAFWTRNAALSLLAGCIVGGVLTGLDPASGLSQILRTSLGTSDFIWVMMIEVAVGVMIAFYLRAGVIGAFAAWASTRLRSRRAASGFAWVLGLFVFFSDYFSPLFAGPIARPLTDRYRVSREQLAYLLDSTSAPVATLLPLSGWAVYIAGLMVGHGPVASAADGMALFIRAIPFNFYGWLATMLAGLLAFGLLPHFGPMRRAEARALHEGKVLRDGAVPLTGGELEAIRPRPGRQPGLFAYLVIPVAIVLGVAVGTFAALGEVRILEAFLAGVMYQAAALAFGRHFEGVADAVDVAMAGIKGVLPAIVILALAYAINGVSKTLGAQQYIVSATAGWMTAGFLPAATFGSGALISFFTGTSWGTYAILAPIVMPVAFSLSGGAVDTQVLFTVGALVGGGLFGDHASPMSDTTCLSSFGAGSDHMDHVTTQLPYALTAAAISMGVLVAAGWLAS
ncbi:MAG: transporter [Acidobacteria bacterium]|nr:transporter [Acidobacteriota bacterium]